MKALDDLPIRIAAFEWLRSRVSALGDVLPRKLLSEGFDWQGTRVPLVGPQGIFKPRVCNLPLTITTVAKGPYRDEFGSEGLLSYRYRGTNPAHRDNVGLRAAMARQVPLIYLFGFVEGRYIPVWPVFIVHDDPGRLAFSVAVEEEGRRNANELGRHSLSHVAEEEGTWRREYLTGQTKIRLHQRSFRERVLRAYREQCSFCRLRHQELLDAAHIIADADPEGDPIVPNGLSLCKLHHAAFDSHFLGVTPDYLIQVRPDILAEPDGPMHLHGLKAMQDQRLVLPAHKRDWPDPEFLQRRFEIFRGHC